jgi:acyl-coenzyme A thioesterase PaaI-like protein
MKSTKIDFNEYFETLSKTFENVIPFNKVMNMQLENINGSIGVKIDMQEKLIGNYSRKTLHGGAIFSVMDVAGGLTALTGMIKKTTEIPPDVVCECYFKLATVNLRIDYINPGEGQSFLATGSVMRAGKFMYLVNIKLHNNFKQLIAVGIGTYKVA